MIVFPSSRYFSASKASIWSVSVLKPSVPNSPSQSSLSVRFLGQKVVDSGSELPRFRVLQMQFALPVEADAALFVDQVDARPSVIVPVLPNAAIVIDGDGERQAVFAGLGPNTGHIRLVGELRGMHADDRHPSTGIFLLPSFVDRVVADTVDAAKRPELDDNDPPAQIRQFQGLAL